MPPSTDRQHYREVLASLVQTTQAKMPALNGRLAKAAKLALLGDVELHADGTATVSSTSDPTRRYEIIDHTCTCRDYEQAPEHLCQHRLAAGLVRKASELLPQAPPVETEPVVHTEAVVTPELPTGIDPRFLTYLHGKPHIRYVGLLAMAHAKGLVSLKAHFISVTPELALAEAEATFADGTSYQECAYSTLDNVSYNIIYNYSMMSLTRAKARCLRDALNVAMAAVEELEGTV
jgi:hypothetical protein